MKRIYLLAATYVLLDAVSAYADLTCHGSNDTAAFNQAMTTVCGTGGGEVVIPPGTCMIWPSGLPFAVCSNLTIRGVGRKSLLKILPGGGSYSAIFGPPTAGDAVSNLVFKDFAVDQSPTAPAGAGSELLHVINIRVVPNFHGVSGITVSGMFFDPMDATHGIHVENDGVVTPTMTNDGNLRATITNNYFNFRRTGASPYLNSAVYLEGSQQVVTGNTFFSTLDQFPGTAVETHGGRSSVSNNTANNYATFANVVPTASGISTALSPNNIVVANNSITCAQDGIILTGISSRTLQNVSIAGNTIQVCNSARFSQTNPPNFAGIAWNGTAGDVDGLEVSNNIISMDRQTDVSYVGAEANNGGILLYTAGNLSNALLTGNIVTNSPISGIRVGSSSSASVPPVQRVRVNDNVIVDAGNNLGADITYRHAIGLWGLVKEVDLMRNMIYDSGSPYGFYSLYLNVSTPSTSIRTSQNTVRGAATTLPILHANQNPSTVGIVDATNANDLLISSVPGGPMGNPGVLNVDFISFTRYITTIRDTGGGQQVVKVPPPSGDSSGVQWTVGQLVTFRFLCPGPNSCLVLFDPQMTPNVPAYSTNGDFTIAASTGRAITFEVESLSIGTTTRKFFELYRTPSTGVAN